MATPEEIAAKHAEFQAAVAAHSTAAAEYEAAREPYIVKTAALVNAIDHLDLIDNELEVLTKDFEPPAKPQPQ